MKVQTSQIMETLFVRRAVERDRLATATVHVRAWQVAYRGIIPNDILQGIDVVNRAEHYPLELTGPNDPRTLIAVKGEDIVGVVIVGPSRDEDVAELGEIYALYVDPKRWRSGAGTMLVQAAEKMLGESAFRGAFLWVLYDNLLGRGFYEATGWVPDDQERAIAIGRIELLEVRYRKSLTLFDVS
jgi:GNAT superfamily N-acetyltransferase